MRAKRPSRPSKKSVERSRAPPPPPPPLLLDELELELELELEELLLPPPGVGPGVTAAAQATVPAEEGAAVVAELELTTRSALSDRPRVSVTITRNVTEPDVGAINVATALSAPRIAGGSTVGATTVQA